MRINIKPFLLSVLIVFLLSPIVWTVLSPGLIKTDDGGWMIVRLAAFHETLKSGQFPVRYLETLNHGFGYPVLNFLYPLPFYLGELLHLILRVGFVDSVKILFVGSFILGSIFMLFWIRPKYGLLPGIVSAILYAYSPYHLFDLSPRGSLGELIAFAFLPLCFYLTDMLTQNSNRQSVFFLSLTLGLFILSHNVIAFLFLPIIFFYGLTQIKSEIFFKGFRLLICFLLGLGLAGFFWIPAIVELPLTIAPYVSVANFRDYQLAINTWSFNLIGWVTILILITTIISFAKIRPKKSVLLFISISILAIFFSTSYSTGFWKISILPKLVQFPWRFLAISVFSSSVLGAYLTSMLTKNTLFRLVLLSCLVAAPVLFLRYPVERVFYEDQYYSTNDDTTTVKNEYMPKWVKILPKNKASQELEIIEGKGIVTGNYIRSNEKVTVQLNKVYYPGLAVYVDGFENKINYENTGLPQINITSGEHKVTWSFGETRFRQICDIFSLIIFLALLVWSFFHFSSKVRAIKIRLNEVGR